jgi:thiosulfate/3-mercaptopyruvate sulfurtransferase
VSTLPSLIKGCAELICAKTNTSPETRGDCWRGAVLLLSTVDRNGSKELRKRLERVEKEARMRWLTTWLRVIVVVLVVGATLAPARAASPRDTLLVTTTWLAQHLNDANLVLLHVGDKTEYLAHHIAGARHTALMNLSVDRAGLSLEMPAVDDLRRDFEALGISDGSRIVVYYDKAAITPATRVMFTLDYAGLGGATSLLDGGLEAWTRDGRDVTAAIAPARVGSLSPLVTQPIVVDADYVLAHLKAPHVAIVDARAASFYDGVQAGRSMVAGAMVPMKTGHIAGAHSVPFTTVTDDHGAFRSAAELAAIFAKAGVEPDDTILGYCHIGQQATAMLFAARTLGHPVLLYDGSFEDWSRHDDRYPVDNPTGKGGGR